MVLVIRQFFPKDYVGLCLWPFIILREKHLLNDQVLINHERIHLQQQWELGILPFYVWYFIEWLWKCLLYGDRYRAYQNISFEREAYANEDNLRYPAQRKRFSFLQYCFKK